MSEFSEKMGIEVGNAFKSGYNCSEAIVEAFRKYAGVNIDDNAFRLASGFGGGIGHARNICGALVGFMNTAIYTAYGLQKLNRSL